MSRKTVEQAFNEILPELGFRSRRDAQYQYAMMVQDKLDEKPVIERDQKTGEDLGFRPSFGAIEAGTGTGKTLGYLIPVLLHIAENGGHARITTHTLALQDQIYGKDAIFLNRQPDFQKGDRSDMAIALEVVYRITGKRLTSAFRKGRQAYVSPLAVRDLLESEKEKGLRRQGEDAKLARDLLDWANSVYALYQRREELLDTNKKDGPKQKLPPEEREEGLKQLRQDLLVEPRQGLLSAFMDEHDGKLPVGIHASDICMVPGVEDNPFHQHHAGNSQIADVLVISHALALFDLYSGRRFGGLLPPATVIVHDEADTLAGVGEMYSRKKIRPDILLNNLQKTFSQEERENLAELQNLESVLLNTLAWFGKEYNKRNPVNAQGEPMLEVPVSEIMLDDQMEVTETALTYLRSLNTALDEVAKWKVPETASMDRKRFHALVKQMLRDLYWAEKAFPANTRQGVERLGLPVDEEGLLKKDHPNGHLALGLSWTPVKKFPSFEVINLYSSRMFNREWVFPKEGHTVVLLTSATLRTPVSKDGRSDPWTHMTRLLGMREGAGREVSVKKFGTIRRVHLLEPAVEPFQGKSSDGDLRYNPNWISGVWETLEAMLATGERGLVLAASFRDVKTVMEGFLDNRIWWQTDSKTMHWRDGVEALRRGEKQIMVTPSVWAGANIRDTDGGQLIYHLGFMRPPTPPVDTLREKVLVNYYRWKGIEDGSKPEDVAKKAVQSFANHSGKHKMTQGIGRGIRAASDVVEIWLMDPRFQAESWKNTFPERFRNHWMDIVQILPHTSLLKKQGEEAAAEGREEASPKGQSLLASLKRPKTGKSAKPGKVAKSA